jgi:hypothetical protein
MSVVFDIHSGALQAQSAKLIGEAIQSNPAFLTLRKIEVCSFNFTTASTLLQTTWQGAIWHSALALQAARDIASTIAASQNRVFLNSDSLLLNLVSAFDVSAEGHECVIMHYQLSIIIVARLGVIGCWTCSFKSNGCAGGDGRVRRNEEVKGKQQLMPWLALLGVQHLVISVHCIM